METFDARYLNTFFKTNKDFAKFLEKAKNICLPGIQDKGVTTPYLLKVARDEVFTISKDKYKTFRGDMQYVTKTELHDLLSSECGMPTGFEPNLLPSKEWLVNCLYSLNPNHFVFREKIDPLPTVAIAGGLLPQFDQPVTWKTKGGVFKRPKEFQEYMKLAKQKKQAALAEKRMKSLQNLINSKTVAFKKLEEIVQKQKENAKPENFEAQPNINEEVQMDQLAHESAQVQLPERFENCITEQLPAPLTNKMPLLEKPEADQTMLFQHSLMHQGQLNKDSPADQTHLRKNFDNDRLLQNSLNDETYFLELNNYIKQLKQLYHH